jgi:hypothetical protein
MRLCFVMLILFAISSVFLNVYVALAEGIVIILFYIYTYSYNIRHRRKISEYIENVTFNVNSATKNTIINFPLPMVILNIENNEIIWCNDRFLRAAQEHDHPFEIKITDIVPDFSIGWLMEGQVFLINTAVIEKNVLTKATRDDESAEMLKIIFDSKFFELGQWGSSVYGAVCGQVSTGKNTYASELEKVRTKTETEFAAVKEYYKFG